MRKSALVIMKGIKTTEGAERRGKRRFQSKIPRCPWLML
jgi:hypothetical protein